MPNATITVYLTDEEYDGYKKDKGKHNKAARVAFKASLHTR